MTVTRREFLAAGAAAGLSFAAPSVLRANQDKVYKTALIGSGWWGRNILREAIQAGRLAEYEKEFLKSVDS